MDPHDYVAERVRSIALSEIRKMLRKIRQMRDVINLTIGEPDFEPFEPIKKVLVNAIYKPLYSGAIRPCAYPPGDGIRELRGVIADKVRRENGIDVTPDEVIITNGAQQGLFISMLTVLDPGDEILIPNPGFVAYEPIARVIGAIPKHYPVYEENRFKPIVDNIEKLITEKTKAILINTPNNPTGAVYPRKVLEEIAELAINHDLVIISDEAYEKFVYDGEHVSIASLGDEVRRRTLTIFSFSKTYGMTGLRLGYVVAPAEVIKHMMKLVLYNTAGVCAPIQIAGIAAIRYCDRYVRDIINEYKRRRDYAYKRLLEIPDISCVKPEGAFYIFPNIGKYGDSAKVSSYLLSEARVGVVPGKAYGSLGEYHVRMYLAKIELLGEAIDRMGMALLKLKS